MNSLIKKDLYRYIGEDCEKLSVQLRFLLFTPGFQFIYFLRKSQKSGNSICRSFWKVLHRLCMWKYGFQIPVETQISEGFRIAHFGSIIVNPGTVIGKNFNISSGCVIGGSHGDSAGYPVIGDNVFMAPNSVILGGVHIGNNVMLAPGALVTTDVPDNCMVIGNPGQIIQKSYSPTDKHIVFKV